MTVFWGELEREVEEERDGTLGRAGLGVAATGIAEIGR